MRRAVFGGLAGAAALALGGCAGLSAADRGPRTDPVARLAPAGASPWTDDLGDPVLADLLRQADTGALDVKAALAKLEHADAELEAAQAANPLRLPVGLAAAVGGRNFSQSRSAATPTVEASYELDLWGRFKRGRTAARDERQAADADVAAGRLMVAAGTVRAYVALRGAEDARAAAARRQAAAQTILRLVTERAAQGAATSRDVDAGRRGLAAAKAQALALDGEIALQTARLSDLTGRRGLAIPPGPLPDLAPRPSPASSDDVDGRPDVQAALARLAAADQRRAGAIAATRPQFQLAAALGAPDANIATLLDIRGLAWAAAGMAAQDILGGPARRAQVHLAVADADLADLAYRQAVLGGWSELRDALTAQARAAGQLELAQADLAGARQALQAGEARHAAGAADGLTMASLQTDVETAAAAVRDARIAVVEARVRRVLAAGGR